MFISSEYPDLAGQERRFTRALALFASAERVRLRDAFAFARDAHRGQLRAGDPKMPYIIHPIRVACSLVDEFEFVDADACVVALLHDVVEDCGVTHEEIVSQFGATIAEHIRLLTWEKGTDAKWRQAVAILRAPRAVRMVKASDIIDNMRATWELTDRGRLLRMTYGYLHWGWPIVVDAGAIPTALFKRAAQRTMYEHFSGAPEPALAPNEGKHTRIEISVAPRIRPFCVSPYPRSTQYARYPVRTPVVTPQDDLRAIVQAYAVPHLRPGDLLAISERIVAITQGRAYRLEDIHPSRAARFLVRFVHKSPYGIGLGSPWTMELALREAGIPRIVLGCLVAAMTKPFGLTGMFYRVVGNNVNAIDGPCDYTLPPYNGYAKLGPKDPDGVAAYLAREVGVDIAIIDANDLGVTVLGASEGVDRAFVRAAFRDNPLGQSREQTPMAVVRSVPSDH